MHINKQREIVQSTLARACVGWFAVKCDDRYGDEVYIFVNVTSEGPSITGRQS